MPLSFQPDPSAILELPVSRCSRDNDGALPMSRFSLCCSLCPPLFRMIVRVHSGHHRRDVYIVNQRLGHCGEHFILLVSADMNATVDMQTLYDAGAHFALSRARRHPTATPYIFSTKDRTDIFDLEETIKRLESAKALA